MELEERIAMRDLSSLPHWWEKTRHLDMPQPKTEYVEYDTGTLINAIDGGPLDVEPLLKAADRVGGYPVFLRTDQMAGKHGWKDTCYVESADAMPRNARGVIDENFMHDMVGEAKPSGLAVREFLDLEWHFKLFYGSMPISTEVRTFVRDGAVECVHPYWPPGSLAKWAEPPKHDSGVSGISLGNIPEGLLSALDPPKSGVPEDWRDILAGQDARAMEDIDTIRAQALKVAAVMDGWWSADMALGRNGLWYLIDMAPGAVSYHWPSCKHKPDDQPDFD